MNGAAQPLQDLEMQVTVNDALEWSEILDDRNPLHSDPESGNRAGIGRGVVNPGPANMAYLMTWLDRRFPGALLETFRARFSSAVFAPGNAVARGRVHREELLQDGTRLFCTLELHAAGTVAVTAEAQIRIDRNEDHRDDYAPRS